MNIFVMVVTARNFSFSNLQSGDGRFLPFPVIARGVVGPSAAPQLFERLSLKCPVDRLRGSWRVWILGRTPIQQNNLFAIIHEN